MPRAPSRGRDGRPSWSAADVGACERAMQFGGPTSDQFGDRRGDDVVAAVVGGQHAVDRQRRVRRASSPTGRSRGRPRRARRRRSPGRLAGKVDVERRGDAGHRARNRSARRWAGSSTSGFSAGFEAPDELGDQPAVDDRRRVRLFDAEHVDVAWVVGECWRFGRVGDGHAARRGASCGCACAGRRRPRRRRRGDRSSRRSSRAPSSSWAIAAGRGRRSPVSARSRPIRITGTA